MFFAPLSGNFRIQAGSPYIDAGLTQNFNHDFDGNQRPCNNQFDLGAFEFQDNCSPAGYEWFYETNAEIKIYPNPVQNALHISGISPQNSEVQIMTPIGARVAIYRNTDFLDVSQLREGLYLLIFTNKNQRFTKIFLKD